jgi:hypothetical protein
MRSQNSNFDYVDKMSPQKYLLNQSASFLVRELPKIDEDYFSSNKKIVNNEKEQVVSEIP